LDFQPIQAGLESAFWQLARPIEYGPIENRAA
jgi:hypothetical protein